MGSGKCHGRNHINRPMPRKIHKLTEKQDLDFALVGISSDENDYHLSWSLNKACKLQLSKQDNLEVFHKRLDEKQEFAQFQYFDENSLILYRLLSNRSETGYLLEELTNVDYILQVSGDRESGFTDRLIGQLNTIDSVRLTFEIDPRGLKSGGKLIL